MLTLVGWLVAAGAAVLVGLLALHLIDDHVTGANTAVTSQEEAARALAEATERDTAERAPHPPTAPPAPGGKEKGPASAAATPDSAPADAPPAGAAAPTPAPARSAGKDSRGGGAGAVAPGTPAPQPSDQVLGSTGGTVVARCGPENLVQLVSWTPHQGYEVEETVPGPAGAGYVKFDAENLAVIVTVSCSGGTAFQHEATETDDDDAAETDDDAGDDDAETDD